MHINLFAQVFFAANMFVMTLFCAYRRLFFAFLFLSFFFLALALAALLIYVGGAVGGGSLTVFFLFIFIHFFFGGGSRKVVKRFCQVASWSVSPLCGDDTHYFQFAPALIF